MNKDVLTRERAPLGIRRDLLPSELPWPETTQVAEALPRRPWRRAEIEAMVRAGIIDEDERFELIGGEAVPMSPKVAKHEMLKALLNQHLQRNMPADLWCVQESTLWLDDVNFFEPDFCIFPRSIKPSEQRGHDVVLAIEIADTSLSYDLGRKKGIYAAHGVAEVWVADALRLVTRVHRRLGSDGYGDVFEVQADGDVASGRRPEIGMNLKALGLSPQDA